MNTTRVLPLAAAAAIIAGCSGGGGRPVAPVASAPAAPSSVSKTATKLVITLPNRKGTKRYALGKRQPKYVSPSTSGMIATVTGGALSSGTTAYQGYTLAADATATSASPATCGDASAAGFTCTLFFDLAPSDGNYTVTLTAYDAAESGTSGTPGTGDNALSTDTESFSVAADEANTEAFTLQGIVRGFYATRQYHGIANAAGTAPVTMLPLDADGNPITGTEGLAYFNGSTFVENATFTPTVSDVHCLQAPCYTLDSSETPITSGASDTFLVDYNGQSDPGSPTSSPQAPPGFGQVGLTAPADYVGYANSPSGSAATEYLEPFFPAVDQTNALATGAASVGFSSPGQQIIAYGIQANMNSGADGYSIDASDCTNNATYGDVASVGMQGPNMYGGYSVTFGTTFTVTADSPTLPTSGSSSTTTATCTIKVYDDNYMDATPPSGSIDEADIAVSYMPSGATLTVTPSTPAAPNAHKRAH